MTEKEDLFNHRPKDRSRRAKRPRYESMSIEKREELKQRKLRLKLYDIWVKEHFNKQTSEIEQQLHKKPIPIGLLIKQTAMKKSLAEDNEPLSKTQIKQYIEDSKLPIEERLWKQLYREHKRIIKTTD